MDEVRKIDTGLTRQLDCEIIDAMFGQLSDGMWENSPRMDSYWPYIKVEKIGDKVYLLVDKTFKKTYGNVNAFNNMSDDKIKFWVATKIKAVIKEEGLDWNRNNETETDYLSANSGVATVRDCYYVYEVLKGRNVGKHPEYMNVKEAKEILKKQGYELNEDFDEMPFKKYLKDFKQAFKVQWYWPDWKDAYLKVISNEDMFTMIHDSWANNDYDPDEMAEWCIDELDRLDHPEDHLDEDFSQGVASMGADQGVPHSMQGCAVPMMRLGEPAPYGKIQKPCPGRMPPPPFRRPPIGLMPLGFVVNVNTSTGKKKKKKKRKKRKSKK